MKPRNATTITATVFGIIVGLAGFEHAIGELSQGDASLPGPVFASWPDSPAFAIVSGEPALSLLPTYLASGLASLLVSLLVLAWAIGLAGVRRGGIALLALSIALLLVGGGFGPPLVGIIVGLADLKNHSRFGFVRRFSGAPAFRALSSSWERVLRVGILAWLLVMPGLPLFGQFFGAAGHDAIVYAVIFFAFAMLFFSILAAYARDCVKSGACSEPK